METARSSHRQLWRAFGFRERVLRREPVQSANSPPTTTTAHFRLMATWVGNGRAAFIGVRPNFFSIRPNMHSSTSIGFFSITTSAGPPQSALPTRGTIGKSQAISSTEADYGEALPTPKACPITELLIWRFSEI